MGYYEKFPATIHQINLFSTSLSSRKLQQKLLKALREVNSMEFSFEEVVIPTVPNGKVIFEFGIAHDGGFNFIDEAELKKAIEFVSKNRVAVMDFFCSIRYYKLKGEKRLPLKFDYYMFKCTFSAGTLEVLVFHERGPRYISPEELTSFIFDKINSTSNKNRKALKKTNIYQR